MLKFRHYVIIRFNVGLYSTLGEDEANRWMEDRIPKFTNYTARSLKNQTQDDFTILILTDIKTTINHLSLIENAVYSLHYKIIPIMWEGSFSEKTSTAGIFSKAILNEIQGSAKSILQTRLDNDDALSPDAIRMIQKRGIGSSLPCAIDMERGYIYDLCNNKMYEAQHYFGTPFVSIFTYCNDNRTIYDTYHRAIVKRLTHIPVSNSTRGWMMIIHERNCSNRVFNWMVQKEVNVQKTLQEFQL